MMNEDYTDSFLDQVNRNIGIVHRVCKAYFTDQNDRQDVYQEILYQLWKSYSNFNRASKFSTWMYKVALNTAITYVRKNNRIVGKEQLSANHYQVAETIENFGTKDKTGSLYAAIATLSAIDKAIILLYLEDNSYEEIASVTGLTKANVSVRLVRIKRALEERLKNIFQN